VIASANRDASVFRDPDLLDLRRADARQHISLGFGGHFCLGASLARLEATVALRTLASRYSRIELACDPDEVQWTGNALLRRLARLPVTLAR
jgi:cytochrome P450